MVMVLKFPKIRKMFMKYGCTGTTFKRCVFSMEKENIFTWKHYQPDIILLTVR